MQQDRRYYGYSEVERIQRNIDKKERWIKNNSENIHGCAKRNSSREILQIKLLEIEAVLNGHKYNRSSIYP